MFKIHENLVSIPGCKGATFKVVNFQKIVKRLYDYLIVILYVVKGKQPWFMV
jgi:hypothetical protein